MSPLAWTIAIALNGSIILMGLVACRQTRTSTDWFMGSRRFPWWVIGLSCYATAIDSSDLIADSGGVYFLGMSYLVTAWVGTVTGWVLVGNGIAVPMYRAGIYTNAEYLEARFGPVTRVISALVQVQYRTLVLGIMSTTLFYLLAIVCGWGSNAWWAVVAIAALAALYTSLGGLASVMITDTLQTLVMMAGALGLFFILWTQVGGWSGVERALASHDPQLPAQMLKIGAGDVTREDISNAGPEEIGQKLKLGGHVEGSAIVRRTPGWLVSLAFFIAGLAYPIVNHTQTMRFLGARSEWDLRMAAIPACTLLLIFNFVNLFVGIMGRAFFPDPSLMPLDEALQKADSIYPLMIREFTSGGFTGLVVAGVLAAAFSTYDSIGSSVTALLTRDVYARLFVRDKDDHHYLRFSQYLTPVIIFGSFLYVPFLLRSGMLLFYLDLVASFVVPLLTIYLAGAFTRVRRQTGAVGLLVGVGYGIWRLIAAKVAATGGPLLLPAFLIDSYSAYAFSVLLTALPMALMTLTGGGAAQPALLAESTGWLRSSQEAAQHLGIKLDARPRAPLLLGAALILAGVLLSFVIFW